VRSGAGFAGEVPGAAGGVWDRPWWIVLDYLAEDAASLPELEGREAPVNAIFDRLQFLMGA
jgi:hypothetical protein